MFDSVITSKHGRFDWHYRDWANATDRALWTKSLGLFAHYNDPTVSAEGFTYLGMALMTMAATPSLPGGADAAWADHALGNITQHFFGVPQLGGKSSSSQAFRFCDVEFFSER